MDAPEQWDDRWASLLNLLLSGMIRASMLPEKTVRETGATACNLSRPDGERESLISTPC